jgi:hypothetical protein
LSHWRYRSCSKNQRPVPFRDSLFFEIKVLVERQLLQVFCLLLCFWNLSKECRPRSPEEVCRFPRTHIPQNIAENWSVCVSISSQCSLFRPSVVLLEPSDCQCPFISRTISSMHQPSSIEYMGLRVGSLKFLQDSSVLRSSS